MKINSKAQMKISFGMIFSIILIIVFLAFAFWGIKKFMGVQESALIAKFGSDVQEDVDKLWSGSQGNPTVEYSLPRKIEGVCFEETGYEENFYFEPQKYGSGNIEHLDISGKICFPNEGGKVTITFSKDFGETLVSLSK